MDSNIFEKDDDVSPASRPPPETFLDFKFIDPVQGLTLSNDGITGENRGVGWRTLFGDQSIDMNCGRKFHFSVRINYIDPKWGNSIGVADKDMDKVKGTNSTIIGYKYSHGKSWGYKEVFKGNGQTFGQIPPRLRTNDIIKVYIDTSDKSISYFRNDEYLGKPFENIDSDEVFPAITLCGDRDKVTLIK